MNACPCGSTDHDAVPFGMVWGIHILVCPDQVITQRRTEHDE